MPQDSPAAVLRDALRLLLPVAVTLTVYLYLYPVFNACSFPLPPSNGSGHGVDVGLGAFLETVKSHGSLFRGNESRVLPGTSERLAPFRLLALGDPQLEGDTSIPNAQRGSFPHLLSVSRHVTFRSECASLRERIRRMLHDLVDFYLEDIPNEIESIRKRIDHVGNDYYLGHIYRTLHWWTRPTHVTVLGDLLGSQWIDDDEFYRRADRYWTRVVRNGERVPDDIALAPAEEYDLAGYLGGPVTEDTEAWARRVINVAGNHDIGYAGDINAERVTRFGRAFGKLNYELRFEMPLPDDNSSLSADLYDANSNPDSVLLVPELRVVVVNDMNLDTPVASTELQDETYNFVNSLIHTATAVEFRGHFTLVLTHVPMYKPQGVCVDEPFFDFHDDGTLREQNLLSEAASRGFLEGLLGMSGNKAAPAGGRGRPGLVLTGHDHEGCDTFHFINQSSPGDTGVSAPEWDVRRWKQAKRHGLLGRPEIPGVREITVRSMMGSYGGNAGLLSLWFDYERWEWRFEYATCALGTQNFWWLVHVIDLITMVMAILYLQAVVLSFLGFDVDGFLVKTLGRVRADSAPPLKMEEHNLLKKQQ